MTRSSIRPWLPLTEKPLDAYRPVSDYVLSGITGVAEGYQQLLKRIDTLARRI